MTKKRGQDNKYDGGRDVEEDGVTIPFYLLLLQAMS